MFSGLFLTRNQANREIEAVKKDMREEIISNVTKQFSNKALGKKLKKELTSEKSVGGFYPQQVLDRREYLGDYSPDEIPLSTYSKMRWDAQIRIGLMAIKMPILSRTFWVECDDKDIRSFVETALSPIWRSLMKSLLQALDFGFSAHEKVFKVEKDYRIFSDSKVEDIEYTKDSIIYKKIKSLHPESISFKYDKHQNFDGFIQNKGRENEVDLSPDKCFVFTNDKEWGNLFGWSRLKAVYPYWYSYWIMDAWHEIWLERRGTPPTVVRHPTGTSVYGSDGAGQPVMKQNMEIAQDIGKSLGANSVVTLPSNKMSKGVTGMEADWSLDYLQDTTRGDVYVEAKRELDVLKLRGLLVPERAVTQQTGGGSLESGSSMSTQHIWLMLEGLKGLITDIEQHVSDYLVEPLVKYNFGEKAPRVTVHVEDIGRELSGYLFELYRQMVITGAAYPSVKKMEEILNIPSESEDEKEERIESMLSMKSMMGGMGYNQFGDSDDDDIGGSFSKSKGQPQQQQKQSQQQKQPQQQQQSGSVAKAAGEYVAGHTRKLSEKIDKILKNK